MSKIPDKRRRKDLDLFVLALVDCGVSTPYELQKAAGLSQGATVPALQRLVEAGFLHQGKRGLRGRVQYRISPTGRKSLKNGWLPLIEAGPRGDRDADLRVALLALSAGGDQRRADAFLRRAARLKMDFAGASHSAEDINGVAPLAMWYSHLRLLAAKTMLSAESSAMLAVANALPRNLTGTPDAPKASRRSTRPVGAVSKGS